MKTSVLMCLISFSFFQSLARAEGVDVTLNFTNVSNSVGEIYYAFYNSQDTYNQEKGEAITGKFPAAPGTVAWVVHDVNPGTYALTAFHDENGNGELDRNILGIPKEQFGFSNVSHMIFSKPKWNDVSFDVKLNEPNSLTIYMRKH